MTMATKEVLLAFRDTAHVGAALDAWAKRHELGRSELLRVFVREGLAARGAWPAIARQGQPERGAALEGMSNGAQQVQ